MRKLRRRFGVLTTVRGRITAALILLSTLATLIGAGLAAVVSTVALTDELGERLNLIALQAHHVIGARIDRALADVQIITLDPTLRTGQSATDERRRSLLRFKELFRVYEDITLLDLNGNIVTSTDYSFRGLPQHRDYFRRAVEGAFVTSGAHAIPRPYKVVVNCAGPVRDSSGRVLAVVVTQLNMEALWRVLGEIQFEKTGHALLVDGRGLVIGSMQREGLFAPCDTALLGGIEGDQPLIRYRASRGVDMVAGAYPRQRGDGSEHGLEPPRSWTVVVQQERREALAAVRASVLAILASAGGLSLMAVVVGFALSRRITRPLAALTSAVSAVASGDLEREVDDESSGEVGVLAANVDQMRLELKGQIEKLSATVEDLRLAREELEERLRFESRLADLSSRFIQVGDDALDDCVGASLGWLLEILGAERVALVQLDRAGNALRVTHRRSVAGLPDLPVVHGSERIPWLMDQLLAGRTVRYPDEDPIPEAAVGDRSYAEELGITALLALPLVAGDRFLGGLVLTSDSHARLWPDRLIPRLELVAHVLANALERQRIETALRRERQLFIRGPVLVLRWRSADDWPVEYASPNVEEVLGTTAEALTSGRVSLASFIHPDDLVRVAEEIARFAAAGAAFFEQEYRIVRSDGMRRWLHNYTVVVRDGEGAVTHYEGYAVDSTDRVEARLELERLNTELEDRVSRRTEELKAANRALEEEIAERRHAESTVRSANEQLAMTNQELESFASSVSHDLRAHLRAIDGFSRIVLSEESDSLTAAARDALERIHRASQRMAEMVDGLLELSRAVQTELIAIPVNLSAIAEEAVDRLRREEPDRRVAVEIEGDVVVHGDPRLLALLMQNLLANAWKFTALRDGARIEFGRDASAPEDDGRFEAFVVRDNGAGFDMRFERKLFVPFGRLHRPDEFPGTGIGLATVQRIVRKHGGCIRAEGTPGEGASFVFTLPSA